LLNQTSLRFTNGFCIGLEPDGFGMASRKRISAGRTVRGLMARSLVALTASLYVSPVNGVAQAQDRALRGTFEDRDSAFRRLLAASVNRTDTPTDTEDSNGIRPQPYDPASPGGVGDDENNRNTADFGAGEPAQTLGDQVVTRGAGENLFDDTPLVGADTRARNRTAARRQGARDTSRDQNEDALLTGTVRPAGDETATDSESTGRALRTRRAQAAEPVSSPLGQRSRTAEDDPFAATGIALGAWRLVPTFEQGVTSTIEKNRSTFSSQTTLRLGGTADGSGLSGQTEAYLSLSKPLNGTDHNLGIEYGLTGDLTKTLTNDLRLTLDANAVRVRESASSPYLPSGLVQGPYSNNIDASLGLEKAVGKVRLGAKFNLERQFYGDVNDATGTPVSQSDRNYTFASLALRGGYTISPALTPFVELEVGRRIYDQTSDRNGERRSATRLGMRGGIAYDLGDKLRGETAIGWIHENIDDASLATIAGLRFDSSLTWSPQRGTSVVLATSTEVEEATSAGSSGALLYAGTLGITQQIRRDLTGTVTLGATYRDFVGSNANDVLLSAQASAVWWLNRRLGFTGRARYEKTLSTDASRETGTATIFAGIRVRR
jgi:hypothetical protein